ncbi:MAG: choice-of-anchor P family protein [Acidimicrobiales bacterium]
MFRLRRPRTVYVLAVAFSVAVLLASPAAHADVDSAEGMATGVVVSGFLGAIPPTPTVAVVADETSTPAALGPFTDTAAGTSLPTFPALFSTGALSVTTSAGDLTGENHAGFVEARTLAQNVNAGAGMATATSIASSCRADGNGSAGTTVIQGGMLNGQPFGNGTPAPNTVIDVPGIGTVTLNEQVRGDVPGSASIIVNAVHARYASGPGGVLPQGQSAEAIVGQVVCRVSGPDVNVPTTTTTLPPQTVTTTSAVPTPTVVTTLPTTVPGRLPVTGSESYVGLGILVLGAAALLRLLLSGRPEPGGGHGRP